MINIVYMEEPAIYTHHSIIIKLKILPVRSLQVATYTHPHIKPHVLPQHFISRRVKPIEIATLRNTDIFLEI